MGIHIDTLISGNFYVKISNLTLRAFLKEAGEDELMISVVKGGCKIGVLDKKTENCLMLVQQKGRFRAWEFLQVYCK